LSIFTKDEPGALMFPGAEGGPIRRGNFNKLSAWPQATESIGVPGLHFHDLRHTGNHLAARSGAGLRDLMARMGHDSERAAMIYQHEVRGADRAITDTIDTQVQGQKATTVTVTTARRAYWSPRADGPLMARRTCHGPGTIKAQARDSRPDLGLHPESG
jgi:hypothetical protein